MTELLAVQADITRYPADVIVNAANESLLGGGGVDGAIHRAAGPELLAATRALGGARTGEAKATGAFGIRTARRIVHTVGPIYARYTPQRAAELLADCYRASLDLAQNDRSIAFPAISTGVYGYPIREAAQVAVGAIRDWLERHPDSALETVALVAHSASDLAILQHAIDMATEHRRMPGLTGSFTIPLDLPLPPERVWPYFAERALREKWVRMPGPSRTASREFDFRVGGGEKLSNTFASGDQLETVENRSVFVDIVENERIIFSYEAFVAGQLRWVALATVDLAPAADGTHLDWTEQYSFVRLSTPAGVDDVKHLVGGTRLRLNGLVALLAEAPGAD